MSAALAVLQLPEVIDAYRGLAQAIREAHFGGVDPELRAALVTAQDKIFKLLEERARVLYPEANVAILRDDLRAALAEDPAA